MVFRAARARLLNLLIRAFFSLFTGIVAIVICLLLYVVHSSKVDDCMVCVCYAPTFSYFPFNYYSITCILSMGSLSGSVVSELCSYCHCVCVCARTRLNVRFVCMSSALFSSHQRCILFLLSFSRCLHVLRFFLLQQLNFCRHIMNKTHIQYVFRTHSVASSLLLLFLSIYFT